MNFSHIKQKEANKYSPRGRPCAFFAMLSTYVTEHSLALNVGL